MSFLRLSNFNAFPNFLKNSIIAIGNFDGVHLGHQKILFHALKKAEINKKPSIVFTFEPHPRSIFYKGEKIIRITDADKKAEIFRIMGFNAVFEIVFNKKFSQYSPEEFVKKFFIKLLKVNYVITGKNFLFGKKLHGNFLLLRELGKKFTFKVKIIDLLKDKYGNVISSTIIRNYLKNGLVENAAKLLGYRYQISEKVIYGSRLGRKLGFPTANMILNKEVNLAYGVYAVKFKCFDGKIYNGIANFGFRPSLKKLKKPILETYIFDFSSNIYEKKCYVSFFFFLRKEKKFNCIETLTRQIKKDEENAKNLLKHVHPISFLDYYFSFS